MTTRRFALWPALTAVVAGLAWATLGLETILRPEPQHYRDALLLVPWCLTLLALTGIHLMQRERSGALGTRSWALIVVSMAVVAAGQAAVAVGATSLSWLAFPVGLLGWTLAMVLFGIATVRAGVLPGWCGVAIALAEPLVVTTGAALSPIVPLHEYGSYSGAIALGIIWLAIGLALPTRAAPIAHALTP